MALTTHLFERREAKQLVELQQSDYEVFVGYESRAVVVDDLLNLVVGDLEEHQVDSSCLHGADETDDISEEHDHAVLGEAQVHAGRRS